MVTGWIDQLTTFQRDVADAERIDQLRALEQLKAAAAAAQARITLDLDASVRATHAAAGPPAERQGRGVAAQVALARQESPYKAGRHLGLAKVLAGEMPHTLAALERGAISEWQATLLARETLFLSREHRELIDTRLCADPAVLDGWGDRRLTAEIQQLAYRLDPAGFTKRRATAESGRRVTSRPAPDTMARVSALLPVAQGVAVYAALRTAADAAIAAGDGRSRGQLMADILVQRVTGQAAATGVPVEIACTPTSWPPIRRLQSFASGSISCMHPSTASVPSSRVSTPKNGSMTSATHAPADEQAQSRNVGQLRGSLAAPPFSVGCASSPAPAAPGSPSAQSGKHTTVVPATLVCFSARSDSAEQS